MKKVLPLTLVLIGTALLITAAVFWIDSSNSAVPQNFGQSLRDWITLLAGLGASIKGWMDLFKPDKPTPPTTKIDVKGGSPQISTGDHARNIQAETYIENQTIQQPSEPKTPKSLNQLPAPPLDFIGREEELAQLRQSIEKGMLISGVQGMGGIGKTALGLKLAEQIASEYLDGQIFLDLRGAHEQTSLSSEQVMAHVIHSFYPEAKLPIDVSELGALYLSILNGKRILLFYDNARNEQQLKSLLPPKSCTLFVTSRQHFTLPGLNVINLETLTPDDARELVQLISPKVNDTDANMIAQQCGFLPLALRASVSTLLSRPDWTSSHIVDRLRDNRARMGLVESSLSLSYDSLDDSLQEYLRQLGVFAAPFDKDAAQAIWGNDLEEKTDELLGKLLRTSLLNYDKIIDGYSFHDLTLLYLEEKCRNDIQADEILWRYADYYLNLAAQTEIEYRQGGDFVIPTLSRFRHIWAHLNRASERLAFDGKTEWKKPAKADEWLADSTYKIAESLQVCIPPKDSQDFAQRGLNASRRSNNQARQAWHLNFIGLGLAEFGNASQAIEYFDQSLTLLHDIDDKNIEYLPLGNLALAHFAIGNMSKAFEYYEQALVLARKFGDKRTEGLLLGGLANTYQALGDIQKSINVYEQALVIAKSTGDRRNEGILFGNLGRSYISLANNPKAIEYLEQALNVARDINDVRAESHWLGYLDQLKNLNLADPGLVLSQHIGDKRGETMALLAMANKNRQMGRLQESLVVYDKALKMSDGTGDVYAKSQILDNMANTYADLGDQEKAIENYRNALQFAKVVGDEELIANIAWNLATVYNEQEQYELAAKYMQITVDFEQKINHPNTGADLESLNNVQAKMRKSTKPEEKS